MKTLFVVAISLILPSLAYSSNTSNDFGGYQGGSKPTFTNDELIRSLEVSGEIYLLDSSGHRLLDRSHERRKWTSNNSKGTIESNWYFTSDRHKPVAIHHIWKIDNDGTIHVSVEQYEKMDRGGTDSDKVIYHNLVKKQDFVITDFSPIVWPIVNDDNTRVVVRLTPSLHDEERTQKLVDVPLGAKDAIVRDDQGIVWTDHVNFTGRYVGLTTHRGTIYFSFSPFKGAKEMGWAKGNEISLRLNDKLNSSITSITPFVPEGVKAKVFAIFKPDSKTAKLSSTYITSTDEEARFISRMEEN
jgi:hypothetical protein